MTSAPLAMLGASGAEARAAQLADKMGLACLGGVSPAQLDSPEYVLLCDVNGLSLQRTGRKAPGPVRVDFAGGPADHRRRFGGGRGQLIARAVGLRPGVYPQVLDVTAGLGGDAFVLASLGCQLTLLERHSVVHALLADGLERARTAGAELAEIVARMTLYSGDARTYLETLPESGLPDVIYLDPMFPERGKSARVKKDMAAFHDLVGKDEDAGELLALALSKARYRVAVKRPRKAPVLDGPPPALTLEGKTSRYDIYTRARLPDGLGQR